MIRKYVFWCLLLNIGLAVIGNDGHKHKRSDKMGHSFVPSHEWQVVKKGQPIPKGLHVRINFDSGVTEARLPEHTAKKPTSALVEIRDKQGVKHSSKYMLQEDLIEVLQNIKNDDTIEINPDEIRKIEDKFRTYDEIKKELDELKLTAKSDAEIMQELVNKHIELLRREEREDEMLLILQDLEYLVHKIDSADEFVRLEGFQRLIYKNLNSSNVGIKLETLNLFGSAVQNNPKVQAHALETGSITILTRLLTSDAKNDILSRCIFALSCLLHRFPLAQKQFVQNGGLTIFTNLLVFNEDVKLKVKLVTLVNDLVQEYQFAAREKNKDRFRQYQSVNIRSKLRELNWCNYLIELLIDTLEVDNTDHDLIEKCLKSILTLIDSCTLKLNKNLRDSLMLLREQYVILAEEEELTEMETDEYFAGLYQLTDKIFKHLVKTDYKSEL